MITILYRAITVVIIIFVAAEIFSQRKLKFKINAGLVLIPLILRVLMIA